MPISFSTNSTFEQNDFFTMFLNFTQNISFFISGNRTDWHFNYYILSISTRSSLTSTRLTIFRF